MLNLRRRLLDALRGRRECEEVIKTIANARNTLLDLQQTMQSDICRLNCEVTARDAEIRALRQDRIKDLNTIEELSVHLRDASIWIADQHYGAFPIGSADEAGVPLASEDDGQLYPPAMRRMH